MLSYATLYKVVQQWMQEGGQCSLCVVFATRPNAIFSTRTMDGIRFCDYHWDSVLLEEVGSGAVASGKAIWGVM